MFKKKKAAITMSETVGKYMCKRFNCQTKNKGQY